MRRVPIPVSFLRAAAYTNLAASRLLGYAPMLTPGKVREITHPDWVCDNREITQAMDWKPCYKLERGLASIFSKDLVGKDLAK